MRLLAALALLPLAVLLCPPVAAEQTQVVPFALAPGLGSSWDATVPSHGPVSIEVVVTRGGSLLGIDIEGPGACSGANAGAGPAGPGMAPTSEVVDCGEVAPANVPLELSTLGGYVRGYLVLRGMTAA